MCSLQKMCSNIIPGRGNESCSYMFILEQPSAFDDYQGKILAGRESKMLDKLLLGAGIDRTDIYLTNAVKCFSWTRNGKQKKETDPKAHEINACKRWLWHEIKLLEPDAIFTMGHLPARVLLSLPTKSRLKDIVNNSFKVEYTKAPIVSLYSLSYLLYTNDYNTTKTINSIKRCHEDNQRSKVGF